MAVIDIDARLEAVIWDCKGCGPPKPLTLSHEIRNVVTLCDDHRKATGHKPTFHRQGTFYITITAGGRQYRSGPMSG